MPLGLWLQHLLLWMLATYGIADVIAKARVGAPLRRLFPIRAIDGIGPDDKAVTFAHLIRCPKCMGAWVSALLTLPPLHLGPAIVLVVPGGMVATVAVQMFFNLFAGAAWCWAAYVTLAKLGAELH